MNEIFINLPLADGVEELKCIFNVYTCLYKVKTLKTVIYPATVINL